MTRRVKILILFICTVLTFPLGKYITNFSDFIVLSQWNSRMYLNKKPKLLLWLIRLEMLAH